MFDDLHSNKFHSPGIQTLQHSSCALRRQNLLHPLIDQGEHVSIKEVSTYNTSITFFKGLACKFLSARFSLDASEMMTEMYQIIVGTSDEMFGPHWW